MFLNLFEQVIDRIRGIITFRNFIRFIIFNKPTKIKLLLEKFKIIFKGVDLTNKEFPWIPIKAKIWLDKFLKPDMILFEYGSGISTIYFSKHVKKVISIEHDKQWFEIINSKIKESEIHNCLLSLEEPKLIDGTSSEHLLTIFNAYSRKYRKLSFEKYCKSIKRYPKNYFDLVFIDGRTRIGCMLYSIPRIKKGGYLMVDDTYRRKYKYIYKFLEKYNYIDFWGIRQFNPYIKNRQNKITFSKTSIWRINSLYS